MAITKNNLNAEMLNRRDTEDMENYLSALIRDSSIEVHKTLGGPGLLENIYETALFHELQIRKIPVQKQVHLPVTYKNIETHEFLRLDLLVDQKVIVEIKAVEKNLAIHKAQLLTYLRLTNLKLGLLINFGQSTLIEGFTRVVNGL